MRSYRSTTTVEQHHQLLTDMPATNNQMSDRDIQTDVIFIQKSQEAISEAKSFDDNNLVINPISPIPSPKEEKPEIMPIRNRGEFFVESREMSKVKL